MRLQHILFVAILSAVVSFSSLDAQESNSLYFMDGIPQSNQLNPANQPRCGFYLGLPGISSLEVNAGNSVVSLSDVFTYNAGLDQWVNPMFSAETQAAFYSKFKNSNRVFTTFRNDWLSFGFRVRSTYFSFYTGERMETYGFIPRDLVRLAIYGNAVDGWAPQTFDLSSLGAKATWYREYAIGISQEISDKFTFGVRGKLLFGKANVNTVNTETGFFDTNMQVWKTNANIDLNTSIPNMQVYSNEKGEPDSVTFKEINNGSDVRDILMNTKNKGFALDLGFVFKPTSMISVSASLLDLGYIRWKDHVNTLTASGTYDFKGIPYALSDTADVLKALADTLKNAYTTGTAHDPYTTSLSPKLYAGIHAQLLKGVGAGFLIRSQLINKSLNQEYTFSVNLNAGNGLNTTFSYTIANHSYDNFGFGLSTKAGPVQWYLMSDRIPLRYDKTPDGIPVPAYLKSVNLRTGFNLVFGCHRNRKLLKDKPLVED